jgi:hypothetical protein
MKFTFIYEGIGLLLNNPLVYEPEEDTSAFSSVIDFLFQ